MSDIVERVTPDTESWDQFGAEHIQRYQFFTNRCIGKDVLDAACGTGYGTHHLIMNGASSATGVDISEEAIRFSKTNYNSPNLNYQQLDCAEVKKLNKQFDVAISFETIEHLQDPELFIKNISEVLSPGGSFICSTPNKARLSGSGNINPFHPNELEWPDFKKIFSKYFIVDECYHQTETLEYLRIQELKHLLHQQEARTNAFAINRVELFFRKILNKPFQPIPYFAEKLDYQQMSDVRIEKMERAEAWHKTFIIVGRKK